MKLIVGLGNPGARYETTRHNIGFLAIDQLIDRWSAKLHNRDKTAEIFVTDQLGHKIYLMKPQTFMNLSGRAVAPFFNFHKMKADDLIVAYDELDLGFGALRCKKGGGSGGHRGILSIDQELGSSQLDYVRVRLGVSHPRDRVEEFERMVPVEQYILQPFTDDEWSKMKEFLDHSCNAIEAMLTKSLEEVMAKFNRKAGSEGN